MNHVAQPRIVWRLVALAMMLYVHGTGVLMAETYPADYRDAARFIHDWNWTLTDAMVDEIRTPCTISRVYAYCNIAAYEAIMPGFPQCRSLAGQLNGLTELPKPDNAKVYDWRITAVAAYHKVAGKMLYYFDRSDARYEEHMKEFTEAQVPQDVIDRSREFGEAVGGAVLAWASVDGLTKIQASSKYTFPKGEGLWEPTPPNFAEPVDPLWNQMRPFVMKNARQFPPDPPVPFSVEPGSDFYKQAREVLDIKKNLTDEQILIAKFWDCNPIHSNFSGHLMFNTRQISPAGHWLNITKIVCKQKDLDMMESAEAYTLVTVALADAFLSCWTEKYRVNLLRPVTYINRYILGESDPQKWQWESLIQTPPFPEHSSGHSTISAAAGTVLTSLLGEMSFADDTEVYLGMPVRTFPSFMTAAREAAMSRLYGGIHYRHGNESGTKNGIEIAEYILSSIHTRI